MADAPTCDRPACTLLYEHRHCELCSRPYIESKREEDAPPPVICGFKACVARHTWGPDDWAGRARMAAARADAGVALDDIDREALAGGGASHLARQGAGDA